MLYDKRVINQTTNLLNYYEQPENIEEIPIDILRWMYKNLLQENKELKERLNNSYNDLKVKY